MMNYERGLVLVLVTFLAGVVLLTLTAHSWRLTGFGNLGYRDTLCRVMPGATLTTLGVRTMLAGFFVTVLGLSRR
jgi:hypothetical protein